MEIFDIGEPSSQCILSNGDTTSLNSESLYFIPNVNWIRLREYPIVWRCIKRSKKDIDGNLSSQASFRVMVSGDAFDKTESTSTYWGDEKFETSIYRF